MKIRFEAELEAATQFVLKILAMRKAKKVCESSSNIKGLSKMNEKFLFVDLSMSIQSRRRSTSTISTRAKTLRGTS